MVGSGNCRLRWTGIVILDDVVRDKHYIIIHHSSTADGRTFSWGAIRDYHVKTLGWSAIGYHWGIERVGENIEVMMGRHPDETGAHCSQGMMNLRSFGVCLVGNFDIAPPPDDQLNIARGLVRWLMRLYNITPSNVLGHREVQAMWNLPEYSRKTCPGKKFDLDRFRAGL